MHFLEVASKASVAVATDAATASNNRYRCSFFCNWKSLPQHKDVASQYMYHFRYSRE